MVQTRHGSGAADENLRSVAGASSRAQAGETANPSGAPQPPTYEVASIPRNTDHGGPLAAAERLASPVDACARPISWHRSPLYSSVPVLARSDSSPPRIAADYGIDALMLPVLAAPSALPSDAGARSWPTSRDDPAEHGIARDPSSPSYSLFADFLPGLAFLAGSTVIATASV